MKRAKPASSLPTVDPGVGAKVDAARLEHFNATTSLDPEPTFEDTYLDPFVALAGHVDRAAEHLARLAEAMRHPLTRRSLDLMAEAEGFTTRPGTDLAGEPEFTLAALLVEVAEVSKAIEWAKGGRRPAAPPATEEVQP